MKIFFFTLGCKVNQYETLILKNIFLKKNFEISSNLQLSDIIIINSCTVTSSSDKKINKIINKIKNLNPKAITILTGCFPQAFSNKYELFKKLDIITGNVNKFKIPELLEKYIKNKNHIIDIQTHEKNFKKKDIQIEKIFKTPRAFLKIEDGCTRYCTYCIIPKARGYISSKSLQQIEKEATNFSKLGCSEIVLVGINLSAYGSDLNENITLLDAVKAACLPEKIKRVRISSLEPNILTKEDILKLSLEKKFCPHFHFSLQSGSNSVLKRMGRNYNKNLYIEMVNFIFKTFKNPSITTDIIVGFPGETEEEFEESLSLIRKIGFCKVHIFPYSKRQGTKAATMPFQIDKNKKKERVKIMQRVAEEEKIKFYKKQQGKILQVLFETKEGDIFKGYSKNYISVKVFSKEDLSGKIKNIKIIKAEKNNLVGEILN